MNQNKSRNILEGNFIPSWLKNNKWKNKEKDQKEKIPNIIDTN